MIDCIRRVTSFVRTSLNDPVQVCVCRQLRAATVAIVLCFSGSASAAVINLQDILGSYAFTNGNFPVGSQSFNIWEDTTGTLLGSDNGDADDLTISYSNSFGPLGTTHQLSYDSGSDRFIMAQSFTGTVSANNPGTRIVQTMDFVFGAHLNITNLELDFTSINTRGITWETATLGYLDENGNPFSAEPTLSPYLSHTSQPGGAGSPSLGWFMADSTATVQNVGTDLTSSGSNGSADNMTGTNGDSILAYSDVGLTAGTRVGGFRWIQVLEDVRGINNGNSNFTATMIDFSPSGTITGAAAVPEPSGFGAIAIVAAVCEFRRRRSRKSTESDCDSSTDPGDDAQLT